MKYKDINDYEVLYMISEGDEVAYNMMYDKYHPLVSHLALKYYDGYKYLGIEYDDLYQEGFVGLAHAISEFEEKNNCLFYTYVTVCIKREMIRLIKKSLRLKHMILNNAISLDQPVGEGDICVMDAVEDNDAKPHNKLDESLLLKRLLDFKYELSDRQALVYELKFNNFTNKEIASLLDLNYKSVDNALKLIRQKIRKYISRKIESVL